MWCWPLEKQVPMMKYTSMELIRVKIIIMRLSSSIVSGDIAAISKQPRPHLKIQGELVGISKISQNLFHRMCALHEENLTVTYSNHYEECISEVSSEWVVPYLRIGDLVWTEIDDQFHFDRALKIIYPG